MMPPNYFQDPRWSIQRQTDPLASLLFHFDGEYVATRERDATGPYKYRLRITSGGSEAIWMEPREAMPGLVREFARVLGKGQEACGHLDALLDVRAYRKLSAEQASRVLDTLWGKMSDGNLMYLLQYPDHLHVTEQDGAWHLRFGPFDLHAANYRSIFRRLRTCLDDFVPQRASLELLADLIQQQKNR